MVDLEQDLKPKRARGGNVTAVSRVGWPRNGRPDFFKGSAEAPNEEHAQDNIEGEKKSLLAQIENLIDSKLDKFKAFFNGKDPEMAEEQLQANVDATEDQQATEQVKYELTSDDVEMIGTMIDEKIADLASRVEALEAAGAEEAASENEEEMGDETPDKVEAGVDANAAQVEMFKAMQDQMNAMQEQFTSHFSQVPAPKGSRKPKVKPEGKSASIFAGTSIDPKVLYRK